MKRHVALVDDEEIVLANFADYLEDAGFRVDRYGSKEAALTGLRDNMPELVVLDIELHHERDAGYAICIELRSRDPRLPVVFFSSHGSEVDRMSGWRVQADEFITKPVSPEYLLVRVEALLRRFDVLTGGHPAPGAAVTSPPAVPAPCVALDEQASTVRWRGQHVDLTLTQFWVVQALHVAQGKVVEHEALMAAAHITVTRNAVAAHIKAIRAAFQAVDPGFDCIRTERSRGYRWVAS